MTVQPSVEKVIKEFHSAKKPIGLELKIDLLYLTELTFINSSPSKRRIKNTSFDEIFFNQIDNDFAYFFYFHSVHADRKE